MDNLRHVTDQPTKHTDTAGWNQGGEARTLRTIATTMATAFFITQDGTMPSVRGLFAKINGMASRLR